MTVSARVSTALVLTLFTACAVVVGGFSSARRAEAGKGSQPQGYAACVARYRAIRDESARHRRQLDQAAEEAANGRTPPGQGMRMRDIFKEMVSGVPEVLLTDENIGILCRNPETSRPGQEALEKGLGLY